MKLLIFLLIALLLDLLTDGGFTAMLSYGADLITIGPQLAAP